MMLFKLSLNNIKKSFKDYGIYFVTLILGVCIFYIFNSIDSQTAMLEVSKNTSEIIKLLTNVLSYVSVFISFVLGFLIIYASRFLIKKRNKEFGIYMTLGMSKRKISFILLIETLLIGFLSLIVGLGIGIITSQITSIFIANLFEADMSKYTFNFSQSAMIKTCIYYGIIYFIVMLFNTFNIRKTKLINLLQASKKQEKIKIRNPYLCISIFILSIIMLVSAYYLVTNLELLEKYDISILLVPIGLGIFGTIGFFYSIAGMFLKIISNCKNIYFKNINTFTFKQISSKVNTMIISISLICIMLFITLCLLTSAFTIKSYFNNSIRTYAPTSFQILKYEVDDLPSTMDDMKNYLKTDNNFYNNVDKLEAATIYFDENFSYGKSFGNYEKALRKKYPYVLWNNQIEVISQKDYNKLSKLFNLESINLNENEYAIVSNFQSQLYDSSLKNGEKIKLFEKELTPKYDHHIDGFLHIGGNPSNTGFVVVNDSVIIDNDMHKITMVGNYKKNVTSEEERNYYEFLRKNFNNKKYSIDTKIDIKDSCIGLSAIVTFIGLYVGLIFLITSSAILALKQLSDCIDDKNKYKVLRQIGVNEKDINKSLFYQTLLFFLAPFILAIVHTIFGLKFCVLILNSLGVSHILEDFIYTFIFLIIIYGIYFVITYLCSKNIIKERI